jgi:hypothetical protein
VVRAPLAIALLAAVLLVVPDQTLEVYRYHIRDWASHETSGFQHYVAFSSLLALGAILFAIARGLTKADERSSRLLAGAGPAAFFLRHVPGPVGAIPLIAAAAGIYLAFDQLHQVQELREALSELAQKEILRDDETMRTLFAATPKAVTQLVSISIGVLLSAAAALIFLTGHRGAWQGRAIDRQSSDRWHWALSILVVCLAIGLVFLFAAQSPDLGHLLPFSVTRVTQQMGSLTVTCLFLVCAGYFASMLVRIYDVRGLPIIPILVGIAALAAALNWNDNHAVRTITLKSVPKGTTPGAPLRPLRDVFARWLGARPADYRKTVVSVNEKYPIYIVAAEGGGMAAANQAGLALARLFDRCPALAHHLFAISGISGGSLGSSMFVALQQQSEQAAAAAGSDMMSRGCGLGLGAGGNALEKQIGSLLDNDFLAPIVASGLFPEMAQQFLPFPVMSFDRSRALEAAIENAWEASNKGKPNIFRHHFRSHWRPEANSPMLVLNTTVVESGVQMMIAPFVASFDRDRLRSQPLRVLYEANVGLGRASPDPLTPRIPPNLDVPLSTAIGLSARFPFVLPAGVLPKTSSFNHRLLDGGIFENSGIETAIALMDALKNNLRQRNATHDTPEDTIFYKALEVRLIIIGSSDWNFRYEGSTLLPNPAPKPHDHARNEGGTEIFSPLRTLYRTRITRGELAVRRAFKSLTREDTRFNMLNYNLFNLPVNFQLAKATQTLIAAHVGKSENCLSDVRMLDLRRKIFDNMPKLQTREKVFRLVDTINANNCSMACIIDEVSPQRELTVETQWCGRPKAKLVTQ